MMKKLLLSVVMTATFSLVQAQYALNFEAAPVTNVYTIGNNGPAATPKMIGSWEVNPVKAGINTSDHCVKDLEEANAKSWAYPILEFGTGGMNMNATNGKYLKVKILSTNKTDFTMTLSPQIAGTLTPITKTFTGVALNTWFETVFDFMAAGDGYVARLDFFFDKNAGIYYIDDLAQSTTATLSSKDFKIKNVAVYPNPANDNISISGDNAIKSVSVFDILGKEVLTFKKHTNLNISDLTAGIYILKTDKGSVSKFIKK
ncbi:T9SS type A sorting domain-containing protein [Mariniflexile maritimum]|uniref:T9SS type A sorting domain-containing protein n=1 Tax=Mariniflexile maritimum TaxID=2682493 RepID=UPI0012F70179|nr:T9SS type A sorting domain-containing protein [Mariniflexile maritimum]